LVFGDAQDTYRFQTLCANVSAPDHNLVKDFGTRTNTKAELTTIKEALARHGVYEPAIVDALLGDCRANVPDVTAEEIAWLIEARAPHAKISMPGFLLIAVPNACQPGAVEELRRYRREVEEAEMQQRERNAGIARTYEAQEALENRVEFVWSQMLPDDKLHRLKAAELVLKNGPTWNRLTEDGRNREAQVIAKAAFRRELAAENGMLL
jgi:hypothetical protein